MVRNQNHTLEWVHSNVWIHDSDTQVGSLWLPEQHDPSALWYPRLHSQMCTSVRAFESSDTMRAGPSKRQRRGLA